MHGGGEPVMIRPFTCVCFLLACGSGLYLYQAKHRVQMIDREIENTIRATQELREQTRVMHAEWTLQNDPQRLQALADQFLALKTVTPGQFTSMADLDSRLPAVRPPEPPPPDPLSVPVAEGPPPTEAPPVSVAPPAKPPVAVAAVTPPRPPEHKPPPPRPSAEAPPRPVVAEALPHPTPVVARSVVTPERPRSIVAASASVPAAIAPSAPMPAMGSALGMARSTPPPPRPMPVSAAPWVNSNGGGG